METRKASFYYNFTKTLYSLVNEGTCNTYIFLADLILQFLNDLSFNLEALKKYNSMSITLHKK